MNPQSNFVTAILETRASPRESTEITTAGGMSEKRLSWLALTLLFATASLAVCLVTAWLQFGSIGGALAFLRGDRLIPDAYSKSIGVIHIGKTKSVSFSLTNHGSESMRILGCMASCSCTVPDKLPLSIEPGETHNFSFTILIHKSLEQAKHLHLPVALHTNIAFQPRMDLVIEGELRNEEQ